MPNKESAFGKFLGQLGALFGHRERPTRNLHTKAHRDPDKVKSRRKMASESRRRNRAA